MRRTILLMVTMALTLLVASGMDAKEARKPRREAGLAGFEPATHGPGNRCSIP
jgi:hypothetical protein